MLENIRLISKEIIKKEFPEEIDYFDPIWEVMKEFIAKWNENIPEELIFEEYQKGLEKELGFLDESEISGFNTPKVMALLSLSWLMLIGVKGQIKEEEIRETITKYGKALPEWLKIKTINLAVPLLKEDLKKIAKMADEEVEEEKKKYVMYSHEYKIGEAITESEYQALMETDKHDYIIWMDEINHDLFIFGNRPQNVYPEERRALLCLVKSNKKLVKYKPLYEAIHNIREVGEWNNRQGEYINDVYKCKSSLMKHCPEIGEYVNKVRGEGYKMDIPINKKYCLVEKLGLEKAL